MPDTEKALGLSVLSTIRDWVKALIPKKAAGIPYGECDATSTSTVFTATVTGVTEYYDGLTVMLKNGVVTSAADFTININNLGAKPCYNNMATGNSVDPKDPTRDTTIFNINYTMLFVYSEDIVSGGGWICYRGYDTNSNTIGYQLRTNSSNLVAADTGYRYRIWLTTADGSKWMPINTSTSTNATSARSFNTRAINPFGPIVYRSTNGSCTSGSEIGATAIWQQYTLTIGYSYVKTLTYPAPVYLKCTPQTDGSAKMNDIVQALPSSNDGKIYIFLGVAYSATAMELQAYHPVYWHDGTGIRIWTGTAEGGSSVDPATATPLMDGTGAVGTSAKYAREDHEHPSDTAKLDTSSTFTELGEDVEGIVQESDGIFSVQCNDNNNGYATSIQCHNGLISLDVNDSVNETATGIEIALNGNATYIYADADDGETSNTITVTSTETIINNVVTPTSDGDAANKQYVDTQVGTKQATLVSGTNIKTVNSTSLLGSGNVAVQPTLVSGTNIKTVNSNSLLGSGNISLDTLPSVSASDNDKVLTVVSGAWAAATPSGGGGVSVTTTTVTIAASDWGNNTCTKSVTGVTASNTVLVTYAPSSKADYVAADIYCSAQGAGTMTFNCGTVPTNSITVNVMIIDGGVNKVEVINWQNITIAARATHFISNYGWCPEAGETYKCYFTSTRDASTPQGDNLTLTAEVDDPEFPDYITLRASANSGWRVECNSTSTDIQFFGGKSTGETFTLVVWKEE